MSDGNRKCVFCENQSEKILLFSEEKLNKCGKILYSRVKFNLKYKNVKLPDCVNDTDGYHTRCYSHFTSLMAKFRYAREPNPITDSPRMSSPTRSLSNSPITVRDAIHDNITPIVDVNNSFTDKDDLNTSAVDSFNDDSFNAIPEMEDETATGTITSKEC